ncbi:chromate efflux transporter [Aestuariicoccus sp. MJ-SS9]|uniref:chromate efflux transporter n=1 Tax=Aestuariicoccus sp. MJ-SS9 TaxID=3079855 RepID=UPI0029123DE1|nr:chromate efflux transporter [Aestuariicoccus sp. MJ-SS9]MDU8913189.1 chromate efflux transporter [Aestuariicoccus sp. MJ-SS9]
MSAPTSPGLSELTRVFGRIGLLSFGGPAAQIALMHRELVDDRPWLTERRFLRALSFCMMLPGPEAMQLATYAGWRLRGVAGGLLAGGLFVGPGAIAIAVLAVLYAQYGARPEATALLTGIKAAVIVIVVQALIRLWRRALAGPRDGAIATLSFLGIFAFQLPFPVIVGAAALWGAASAVPSATKPEPGPAPPPPWRSAGLWLSLWLGPLAALWLTGQTLLFELGAFFAKLAVVTFGGAYAVLAYMAQEVVQTRGWLYAGQMVDALGLAETTPGPLILVTQFVGMTAGHAQGGVAMALLAGALTLWMTFVPCFLWIFAGAPYIDRLPGHPRIEAALAAITAAVVGVILNLSLWFAIHVLFARVTPTQIGPVRLPWPDIASLDSHALALVGLAAILAGPLRRGLLQMLLITAAASWFPTWI